MNRLFFTLCFVALSALLGGSAGCSRQHYRMKADHEVYSVLKQGNNDTRWKVENPKITPDAASRMYDPYHPDREPMPSDDPAAHRKMHSVAGMKGSTRWHENGDTTHTENPRWRQYLLVNDKGEVPLDKDKAVELGRLHSPEYQTTLENLYLAAMNVSQEQYRYDVQFFGNGFLNYGVSGGNAPSLRNDVSLRAQRALASGGNWAVELANSITWTLNGQGDWRSNSSVLNVGVVQPLLRGASRKVVLENLTQAERNFLMELRRTVLFQQGHYTRVVTGTAPRNTGVSGAGGGFYRLLANQISIQNQRQNTLILAGNLDRFSEMFDAGQLDNSYQVEQTRQSLLSSQSNLLGQINSYQSSVETYISSLGLPPDLKVEISDPLLELFQFTSPSLSALMEDFSEFRPRIRRRDQPLHENFREEIKNVIRRTQGETVILEQDLETLQKRMPERRANLKNLEMRLAERIAEGERVAPEIYDSGIFENRIAKLITLDIPQNRNRLRATFVLLDLIADSEEQELRAMIHNNSFDAAARDALRVLGLYAADGSEADAELEEQEREIEAMIEQLHTLQDTLGLETPQEPLREAQRIIAELRQRDLYRDWILRIFSVFQNELVTLSMMQTRTRIDTMTLVPISITPEEAFQVAAEHRLDWMNRKAQLVDTWRRIDIAADRLKGVFDVRLNGSLGAIDNRGVRFDSDTGSLDVRFEWDSPLTRYNEMMAYRRSQIDYQRARRDYYTYVDSIQSDLRNTLRDVQMSQINFEINRNAILTGTIRVDLMQIQMDRPPQRGTRIDTNTSQQLIDALDALTRSQNDMLNTWVTYQTQRMLLDLYMGTMTLDEQGRWIEPGVMGSATAFSPEWAPTLPAPPTPPMLPLEAPRLSRRYVE